MNDETTVEIEGQPFRTGCVIPRSPAAFAHIPVLADTVPDIELEEAKAYCAQKTFNAKEWFGDYVKNQGSRGSCNGYAGAGALRRARFRRRLKDVDLSGEGLYVQINGGQDQGSLLVDGMEAIVKTGIPSTKYVPHEEYRYNRVPQEAWEEAKRFRGHELYQLKTEGNLITALAKGFDIVVAVHVGNNWMTLDSKGVVPNSPGPGNHAVCVDDIRFFNGEFQYLHAGSWGKGIHDQGYGWLTWDRHFATTVQYHGFYAIRSTLDDPQEQ